MKSLHIQILAFLCGLLVKYSYCGLTKSSNRFSPLQNFLVGIPIGEPCDPNSGDVCVGIPGTSECLEGVCVCKDDFFPNPDYSTCLSKIGVICGTNEDCVGPASRTKCDMMICKCRESYHIPNLNRTTCFVRIGGPCNDVSECTGQEIPSSVDCISNQCQCADGYVRGGAQQWSKCLPIINQLEDINNPCEESVQCRAGIPGQFSECTLSDPNNDQSHKICRCTADALHEVGKHICFKKSNIIGGPCQIQAQCENLKARCTGNIDNPGVCQCEADHVPRANNTLCLEKRQLGEMCEESGQCVENSICSTGICICIPEAEEVDGVCIVEGDDNGGDNGKWINLHGNLTFSADWDLSIYVEGSDNNDTASKNKLLSILKPLLM